MGICKVCGISREWIKDYCNAFCKKTEGEIDKLIKERNERTVSATMVIEKINLNRTKTRPSKKVPVYFSGMKQDFYLTREWKELRYKAIKIMGKKCMACNAADKPIHVDHIKPRSKYPERELSFENLQILCDECNLGKSNLDETDWRPKQ